MKFSDRLADRIRALLERRGQTVTGVAREMDRSHDWLLRKLKGVRPLYTTDIDEVLDHLDEDADALLKPVLCHFAPPIPAPFTHSIAGGCLSSDWRRVTCPECLEHKP